MTTLRDTFSAAVAALLVSSLVLAGCEKAASGGPNPTAAYDTDTGSSGSTVPALPALSGPMFSPDLVDRVGNLDLFAIAESRVALARSKNPQVKSFASAAIETHTKSTTALGAAVDASGLTMSMPDSMSNDLAAKVAALQTADAATVDQAYLTDQIAALNSVNNALKTFAKHGDVSQLKTYATAAYPSVESSLTQATALQSSLR